MMNAHDRPTYRLRSRQPGISQAQAGQSLIELALCFPLLLLIMVGTLDLSRLFQTYITAVNATREGAHYAAFHPTDDFGIRDVIEQEAAGSTVDLSQSTVTIHAPEGTSPGHPITVSLTLQFPLMTQLVVGSQNIAIQASTTMVIE
jgi:Flp pilus assembly protein TadG